MLILFQVQHLLHPERQPASAETGGAGQPAQAQGLERVQGEVPDRSFLRESLKKDRVDII